MHPLFWIKRIEESDSWQVWYRKGIKHYLFTSYSTYDSARRLLRNMKRQWDIYYNGGEAGCYIPRIMLYDQPNRSSR